MIRPRRVMLTLAGAGLVLPPRWLRAQEARPKRLGVLSQLPRTHPAGKPFWESVLGQMKALGWDRAAICRSSTASASTTMHAWWPARSSWWPPTSTSSTPPMTVRPSRPGPRPGPCRS